MGFFDKIKDNLQRGGVKIAITAPESIAAGSTSLPIHVSITSTGEPQKITSISVVLQREYDYTVNAIDRPQNVDNNANRVVVLSRKDIAEPFDLPAGKTADLDVELAIPPDSSQQTSSQAVNKVLGVMSSIDKMRNKSTWSHYILVSADVEGIMLDPTGKQRIRIDGQESSAINLHIG